MPKVFNKHHKDAPPDAIYVGRPTKWGNPFIVGKDGTRDEVVEKYREWLYNQWDHLEDDLKTLKGKDLVCWCSPKACHADILLEISNAS